MKKILILVSLLLWFVITVPAVAQPPTIVPQPPPSATGNAAKISQLEADFEEFIERNVKMKKKLEKENVAALQNIKGLKARVNQLSIGLAAIARANAAQKTDSKTLEDLHRRAVSAQQGVNELTGLIHSKAGKKGKELKDAVKAFVINPRNKKAKADLEAAWDAALVAANTETRNIAEGAVVKANNAFNRAEEALSAAEEVRSIAQTNATSLKALAENTAQALEKLSNKRAVNPLYWRDNKSLRALANIIRQTGQ